jgi:two-component system, sensor histidine kinase and response regulator
MVSQASVLLVDDLPDNLEVMQVLLARPGLELVTARSAADALEVLLSREFAAAVLDVQMPGMDGFELAELMRGSQRTRHVPIIFVTAGSRDSRRVFRGYEAGAVDFLYKPLDPPVLRGKVEVFVEMYLQRRQLASQLDALREALRLNETFTAVLGHDLRTPLSAVVTAAEVLLRGSNEPLVTTAAARIRQSADRMARMIDQLLDLAMLRSGRLELHPEPADLLSVCTALAEELDPGDPSGSCRIDVGSRGDTCGSFDVDRVGEVVSNLLGNALQHGTPGGPVTMQLDGTEHAWLCVTIHNAGAMAQAPPAEGRTERRLGLGLQIAEQFVRAHGGVLASRSSPAEGTTFEVRLPRTVTAGRCALAGQDSE